MEIKAKEITVEIGGKYIFKDISISIEGNKMIAITGRSGCGKTTLLNCLGLIQNVKKGNILIDGSDTSSWNDFYKTKFWHESAGFIYQDYGIIDNESVYYNVTLNKWKQNRNRVDEVLSLVGLVGRGNDYATVLSGGEKQRIGIARAIYKNSEIIFADEPTASLDSKNREQVVRLLKNRREEGVMIVIATHDERLISECDENIDIESLKI